MEVKIEEELKNCKTENIVDYILYQTHKKIDSMEDIFACQIKDDGEVYCLDINLSFKLTLSELEDIIDYCKSKEIN